MGGLGMTPKDNYNMFSNTTTAEPQNMNQNQTSSESHTPQSRIFQFNSASNSSASPSASSVSQYGNGASSSCGTSPEPSHNSPATGNKDATLGTISEQGQNFDIKKEGAINFCEELNKACGNIRDPQPRTLSKSNPSSASTADKAATTTFGVEAQSDSVNGMDYFVNQNGGQFDPILFGDYRDSTAAIVGDGDFTGGFFNDAMPNFDFSAPLDWNDLTGGSLRTGLTPAIQKPNPMEQADALLSGIDEEEVVPADNTSQMLSCHKIWYDTHVCQIRFVQYANCLNREKVQERQDFKDGALDIDGLCDELRAKAKCSESGVVIDQKDVDAALQRLPAMRKSSN
jgi:AP-1-like factor